MKIFFRVFAFLKPYKWLIACAMVGNILLGAFGALTMAIIQPVMSVLFSDNTAAQPIAVNVPTVKGFAAFKESFYHTISTVLINPQDNYRSLLNLSAFILGMFIIKNIVKYITNIINTSMTERLVSDIRNTAFRSITAQSMDFFNQNKTGELLALVTNEAATMNGTVIPFIMTLFKNPIEIILLLLLLLSFSVKLTLIAFSTSIAAVLIIRVATKYLRRYASRMAQATAAFISTLQETLSGIRVVKAFNAEDAMSAKFLRQSMDYVRSSVKMTRVNDLVPNINEILAIGALCVVLYIGGSEVFSQQSTMKGADLMTFLFALFAIMSPVSALTSIPGTIQRGIVASERVFAVIDRKPTIVNGSETIESFTKEIRIENIEYSYIEERPVLKNISLTIPRSQKIAFVGASGSGKSTMIDLIIRFYDPQRGRISMDGRDIRTLDVRSYRSRFGIVSQEPTLFNDSVSANITFGQEGISRERIREAAIIAHAHEFIEKLPDGYDTVIGDRGVMLSGGQRQRVAIARAIALNPDVLIFDEATSALDSESEKIVQQAIANVLKNRTAIIIAHRLSTVIDCDNIVVFDNGEIVEQGTHQELLERNGVYKRLYTIQYAEQAS